MGEDLIKHMLEQSPIAAAIALPLFYFLQWLRSKIVEPIASRIVTHIDTLDEQTEKQTETLGKLELCMSNMQRVQQEHLGICRTGSHEPSVRKPVNGGG